MKKFLLFVGCFIIAVLAAIYLAFLFYLPRAIDLTVYKPTIQQLAKEEANLDIEIENPRIVTTPNLQAGIKTDTITVKLPDNSILLSMESFQTRISIPQLLLLTIKVPCVEIASPRINLEIADGEQFKVVRLVEDILNRQKEKSAAEDEEVEKDAEEVEGGLQNLPFDLSMIKIKVPGAKITDYKAVINDLKTGHSLTITGDTLRAGYNNGKTASIKTNAKLLSDDKTNITANVDIISFIPPMSEADPDDDPAEKIELPFVNPVLIYRDYDLKSNVNAKLRILKNKEDKVVVKGILNVDGATMNLSGLQLPESNLSAKFYGMAADLDTNIYLTDTQNIKLKGKVDYGKKPKADLDIVTERIFFNDMIILSKAFLDTLHIKNNLGNLKATGYWGANAQIKTDFKNLKSKGCLIARNGRILNDSTKLVFDKINANLIFENNKLEIVNTHTLINNKILEAEGTIDTDAYTDIKVHSDALPLPGLFLAFAPSDLKKSVILSSGTAAVDASVQGLMENPITSAGLILDNLTFRDRTNMFVVNDEKLIAGIVADMKTLDGNISNKNFGITLPGTGSTIKNPSLKIKFDEKDISTDPFNILINNNSNIEFNASVDNYTSSADIELTADGKLSAADLRKFAGRDAEPFISAAGTLPLKASLKGNAKKQTLTVQLKSDGSNYITPIDIDSMLNKQSLLQAKVEYKGDRLHIRKTGLYTGIASFGDNLEENMNNAQKVAEISGTIVGMNSPLSFINIVRLELPNEISGRISAFKNSSFKAGGNLIVFGKLASPLMNGSFSVKNLKIPELLTSMNQAKVDLLGKNITLNVEKLLLNDSDLDITAKTDINPHPVFTISRLDVNSQFIDLDKLMKVMDALNRYMAPPLPNAKPATDIPAAITNGSINLKEIKTGEIVATNTTGRISLKNNLFNLRDLKTTAFEGIIRGNVIANIITMAVDVKTKGEGLNVEKALLALANMKDTLTGTLDFKTDIWLQGLEYEKQVKSLTGKVDFTMKEGQLGPFGKIENMILAENIRESEFFQTALGGVINNLTTIDTSHFSEMTGEVAFKDGIVDIIGISSTGNVMTLHILGNFDILNNTTDMKVRAKLGSAIANMLGPISQLNPINLVQETPGLNVVLAKAFSMFCEQVTPEEFEQLPDLPTKLDNDMATKFQIVLRGDVAKPLSLIKSFKWLALESEINQAQQFTETLPDPSIVGDPNNATLEEIRKAQELQAKEEAKLINRLKRFFKSLIKKNDD